MEPITIAGFKGINNRLPDYRIGLDEFAIGSDIDLDNSGRVTLRPGYNKILSLTGAHSGFSAWGQFLFVRNCTLWRFFPTSSTYVPLIDVKTDATMRYWAAADRIFFTNGVVIGEVRNGVASLFPATTIPYKAPLPAGQAIAHFKGRLYVARGKVLWISDVKPLYRTDLRHGFKQFPDRILVIAPTSDGIYIGTEKRVYFMNGSNPLKMSIIPANDSPCKEIPPVYIESEKIKGLNADGVFPLIVTDDGISAGLPQGNLANLTGDSYVLPNGYTGTAIVRINSRFECRYIAIYQ